VHATEVRDIVLAHLFGGSSAGDGALE
jgi:hypothetical protein